MAIKLEEIEDRLVNEAEALEAEMQRLRHEWTAASENAHTAIEQKMQAVMAEAKAAQNEIVAEMERAAKDSDAIIAAYGDVVHQVSEATRADIEKEATEAKAAHATRIAKLEEAGQHIQKVLRP